MQILNQEFGENWAAYHGDCVEVIKGLPDNSVHYSIFSPPFSSLFTYSDSERDMGNSKGDGQFAAHFDFMVGDLFRVIKSGRLVSIHCMNLPAMKERDGYIGLKDFRGDMIRMFQKHGFIFHSEVCIWKDPLIEATRTKALGLMHKQIEKDSSMCRNGLPDYIVTMRKPGANDEPISHKKGFKTFHGECEPTSSGVQYSHDVWRRYANPVWCDINQSNTLNVKMARDGNDERHICPLQLDTIARCLELWSNPGDTVLSPFGGIGSEGYQAALMGRKAVLIELKESYFTQLVKNMRSTEIKQDQLQLFA
jgi:hypothetical protein